VAESARREPFVAGSGFLVSRNKVKAGYGKGGSDDEALLKNIGFAPLCTAIPRSHLLILQPVSAMLEATKFLPKYLDQKLFIVFKCAQASSEVGDLAYALHVIRGRPQVARPERLAGKTQDDGHGIVRKPGMVIAI